MTGKVTAYGGSGVVEHGAAGVTYIKAGLTTKIVCTMVLVLTINEPRQEKTCLQG